jgi:hypothetical protein
VDWVGRHGIDGRADAPVSSTGRSSDSRRSGGTAKILGVAAVLTPGPARLKEWAFAGLTFDLTGALYSHLSVGDPASAWMPAAIGLALMAASYVAYRSRPCRADSQARRITIEGAAAGARIGLRA